MKEERNAPVRNGGDPKPCLKSTGLKSVGDLLTTTEAELSEYLQKRFIALTINGFPLERSAPEMKGELR